MRGEGDTTGNLFGAEVTDDIKLQQQEREHPVSPEEAAADWDDLQKHIPPADEDRTDLQAKGEVSAPEQPLNKEALEFLEQVAENDKAHGRASMAQRIIERDKEIAEEYRASQARLDREIDESDAAYRKQLEEQERLDKAA